MAKPIDHAQREERLAAKLRENLYRRKAQARGLGAVDNPSAAEHEQSENDLGALSKQPPES